MTLGSPWHSALNPAGPQAAHIARLTWILLGSTTIVFVIVLAFLGWATVRGVRRRRQPSADPPASEVSLTSSVAAGVVLTVLILIGLLTYSIWTDHLLTPVQASNAIAVAVTGHQWWWEIEYEDRVPSHRVTTANELHIPTGRPVVLTFKSADVIHSFWAPSLHGKRDLIPGYTTTDWIQADRPGLFRGQCAEFCGKQHAHMAFTVVAQSEAEFEHWLNGQRALAQPPTTDHQQRGQQIFLAKPCSVCHTVLGTPAHGHVGPDLTHVASRTSIAARTLTTSHQNLASWIQNSQAVKPGNHMPPHELSADDVDAVVAYLQSLQ